MPGIPQNDQDYVASLLNTRNALARILEHDATAKAQGGGVFSWTMPSGKTTTNFMQYYAAVRAELENLDHQIQVLLPYEIAVRG